MAHIISEFVHKGIVRLAINLPEKRNAIAPNVRDEFLEAISACLFDENVLAIVLGSEGGHFCSGGDIDSMFGINAETGRKRMQGNHKLVRAIAEAEKPIVSAVEGFAMGAGAGICLLTDTIVIADNAKIGFPFFKVGLTPDYGILFTLPRRVGWARARQILLRGTTWTGVDAVKNGLADEVVEMGSTERHAVEIAREMASAPPHAFALTKRHLVMEPQSLEAALELETLSQSLAFVGPELAEGRAAFLQKRRPDFQRGKK